MERLEGGGLKDRVDRAADRDSSDMRSRLTMSGDRKGKALKDFEMRKELRWPADYVPLEARVSPREEWREAERRSCDGGQHWRWLYQKCNGVRNKGRVLER